jgi:transcriptional regulator with XRE-family HTH domain
MAKPSRTLARNSIPVDGSNQPMLVGPLVRSTRKLKGMKLIDIAEKIGCSESLLSKIETGKITPSLSTLIGIANCLQVEISALLSGEAPRVVSRAGTRLALTLRGHGSSVERLVSADGKHLIESNLHTLQPGARSGEALSHQGEEVGYVIEGQFELTVGQEVFTLSQGDSFNFRSEARHSYRNPGKEVTRVLWASTPSRSFTRLSVSRLSKTKNNAH